MQKTLLMMCIMALAVACGGSQQKSTTTSYGKDAKTAYQAALVDFKDEDCMSAEPAFRDIAKKYPYSKYASLAELRVGDCLVMQAKFADAISSYEEFIRRRPSHPEVPYATFKIAETHYKQIPDEWFLSPPAFEKDQIQTRKTIRQLQKFIQQYPTNRHVPEAKKMGREAVTMMARHEYYVAQFYLKRNKPMAAVLRLESLLENYSGSLIEPEVMWILGQCYLDVDQPDEANKIIQELARRYPSTSYGYKALQYAKGRPAQAQAAPAPKPSPESH